MIDKQTDERIKIGNKYINSIRQATTDKIKKEQKHVTIATKHKPAYINETIKTPNKKQAIMINPRIILAIIIIASRTDSIIMIITIVQLHITDKMIAKEAKKI